MSVGRYNKHWVGILGGKTLAHDLIIVALDVEGLNAHLCTQWLDHCDVCQFSGSSKTVSETRLFWGVVSAFLARKLLQGCRKSRPKCIIVSGTEVLELFSSPMAFCIMLKARLRGCGCLMEQAE